MDEREYSLSGTSRTSNRWPPSSLRTSQSGEYSCYKVIMIGDQAVGKSALVTRFAHNEFDQYIKSTIGNASIQRFTRRHGERVQVDLWDTAGQEKYAAMLRLYTNGTHGGLACFDVTDPKSLDVLRTRLQGVSRERPNAAFALVACKCDLQPHRITQEQMQEFSLDPANGIGEGLIFLTSAKEPDTEGTTPVRDVVKAILESCEEVARPEIDVLDLVQPRSSTKTSICGCTGTGTGSAS